MTEEEHHLTPQELAQFDQAWADSETLFLRLCQTYDEQHQEQQGAGVPAEVTVVGLARFLAEQWDADQLSSALAYAVVQEIREHRRDR